MSIQNSNISSFFRVPTIAREAQDECFYQISAQRNSRNRCGDRVQVTEHEYCVIGAGPSGLQTALFLKQAGRDYVVLERNATAGAFFQRYPRHRRLISINKPFTGTPDNAGAIAYPRSAWFRTCVPDRRAQFVVSP